MINKEIHAELTSSHFITNIEILVRMVAFSWFYGV